MKKKSLAVLLFLFSMLTTGAQEWKLTWSDEFDKPGLPDSSKWSFDTRGNAWGWGNNELQYYTDRDSSNAFVQNGVLRITALAKEMGGKQYTSARLISAGKAAFRYGRMAIRARLPGGRGTWPAIWMLGSNIRETGWPACGEIDIMEYVGYEPDSVFGTVHTTAYNHVKGTQRTKGLFVPNLTTDFHEYAIEWSPEAINFFVDGKQYNHFPNEKKTTAEWPFDQPCYFILNLAIGGNWGGKKGVDPAALPAIFEVDYVRVYSK